MVRFTVANPVQLLSQFSYVVLTIAHTAHCVASITTIASIIPVLKFLAKVSVPVKVKNYQNRTSHSVRFSFLNRKRDASTEETETIGETQFFHE